MTGVDVLVVSAVLNCHEVHHNYVLSIGLFCGVVGIIGIHITSIARNLKICQYLLISDVHSYKNTLIQAQAC